MNNTSSSSPSPATTLSYDVFREIFTHCVQQSSAQTWMQPNIKIAPMLLCQVCVTWRAVALSSPSLWSHLRFELPINWDEQGRPFTFVLGAFERRLEWLQWWRRNLGSMAPYLQVEVRSTEGNPASHVNLTESALDFLFEFMSSAQYLCVGRLYRYLAQPRIEAGTEVQILPNAHTIVNTWSAVEDGFESGNQHLRFILTQTHSTLRHLVIENAELEPQDYANPLHNWSALTHLSMRKMSLHLNTWFSFIRSLSALQWGSFRLSLLGNNIDIYAPPTICALPDLSVFHISVFVNMLTIRSQKPLKAVFDNLRLPALRTLSLESRISIWDDAVITEIHDALQSAPVITKLSIGLLFFVGHAYATPQYVGQLTAVRSDIEPLSVQAPQLEELSFHMLSHLQLHGAFHFVNRIFSPGHWLDLKDPTSTIRKVTILSLIKQQPKDRLAENLLISEVRKFVHEGVSVVFQEEEPIEVQRTVWDW